jgi:hypothetical protein
MCLDIAAIFQSLLAALMSIASMLCDDAEAVVAESEWSWLCCANAWPDVTPIATSMRASCGKSLRSMERRPVGV